MCIRIQLRRATVKDLHSRLQDAYGRDDRRLVRRPTVLLDLLVHHVPVAVLCERWGLSPACLYAWQQAFLLRGLDRWVSGHGGGRRPQVTPSQKKRLVALLDAGPLVVGCETACWHAVLSRVLLWRECGVLYNRQYVGTLLHHGGFSFQQAGFVADHLDAARRQAWLQEGGPQILRAATHRQGLSRFEDAASGAQGGSLSYPWARRGQQPEVNTRGKRKGSKVFGALDSVSGRLFSQGLESRFTSDSAHAFWTMIRAQTTQHLLLMHDGARDPPSPATQQFLTAHRERLTAYPLPSYAPDDHPIAYLWKKTKQRATHQQYCKEWAALTTSVDKALAYFATHPDTGFGLFGRYWEESGLELKQAASLSKSKPEHL